MFTFILNENTFANLYILKWHYCLNIRYCIRHLFRVSHAPDNEFSLSVFFFIEKVKPKGHQIAARG